MSTASALNPRIFVSYVRRDGSFVGALVGELKGRGFRVFQDTSDIDPGDNFVTKLAKEIDRATAVVAVVSKNYPLSRWAQAELYRGIASGKLIIPLLISNASINDLDEPLVRLLRDTQYLTINTNLTAADAVRSLGELLDRARLQHQRNLLRQLAFVLLLAMAVVLGIAWVVNHSNELENSRKRERAVSQIKDSSTVLQHERIVSISSLMAGDRQAIGEIAFMSQDPSLRDISRFNSLALSSELRKGQKERRWYLRDVHVKRSKLEDITLTNVSFLGGSWVSVEVTDSTFSGTFWSKDKGFSMSGTRFRNVQFFGGIMEDITLVDVAFVNTKFRGMVIDSTNFSKVRFATEGPKVEGNPVITPDYTLFEHSVLLSHRSAPKKGVLDLTMTGDDVVFDGVVFVDCRLEGWFQPEWFRNSSFQRCYLPESLNKESLLRAGNTIE